MTKEALTLALEALELCNGSQTVDGVVIYTDQEIAAIKKALAQPEQEPVAWMSPSWIDPYTRGWQSDSFESIPIEGWLPLYTTPPQRTWVGLTGGEVLDVLVSVDKETVRLPSMLGIFARAIEAKLKEKNT